MIQFEQNFIGKNGFYWFFGVVEDRNDPLKLGRVRVRVHGWDTDKKSEIASNELPWAHVGMPTTSGSVNGSCETSGLVEGSWVYGFFMDGIEGQEAFITHSFPGIPINKPDSTQGFNDPRTNLSGTPKVVSSASYSLGSGPTLTEQTAGPFPRLTDEPETPRLARNDSSFQSPVIANKAAARGVIPDAGEKYAAVYPYNKVKETESGHVQEFDDTPGAERVHLYHRTGSDVEFLPDGSVVFRSVKDLYQLIHNTMKLESGGTMGFKTLGSGDMTFDIASGTFKITNGPSSIEVTSTGITIKAPRIDFNP